MTDDITIRVNADGSLDFIYTDERAALLFDLGHATVTRASHVEPSETSAGWIADMAPVNGPVLGPFSRRQQALDKEVEWLQVNRNL